MINELNQKHSLLLKKSLKCLNIYSSIQTSPTPVNGYDFSFVDLQILSAFYPNKKNQYNMTTISSELGIAPSTFSKSVSKLTKLGLLEKYHKKNNKKNVIVWLSAEGEKYIQETIKGYEEPLNCFIQSLATDPLREKYYLEFVENLESFLCPVNDTLESDNQLIPVKNKNE